MLSTFERMAERVRHYEVAPISSVIVDGDLMFEGAAPNALDSYLAIGRSAIKLIAEAMTLSGKMRVESVLDLPCGGGRLTRHLKAFLPEATVYASDLNQREEAFVAEQFGAERLAVARNFDAPPPRAFDLIFVGSLLTHFDASMFVRTLRWFIGALAPDGLLVLTTHGRRAQLLSSHYLDAARREALARDCAATGFGFVETERIEGMPYGISLCQSSWLMRTVEHDERVRLIALREAAWADHHDVLMLQRRPIALASP